MMALIGLSLTLRNSASAFSPSSRSSPVSKITSPSGASIIMRLEMPMPTRFQILGATSIILGATAKVAVMAFRVEVATCAPRGPCIMSMF